MSDASARSNFWLPFLHFPRGAAVGGLAVLLAVVARQYFAGGAAPGDPGVIVAIFAILLPAALLMDRAMRYPRERLSPPLLLESLAVMVATSLAAFVGLLVVPQEPSAEAGLIPMLGGMLLAFGLLGLCPWYAQAALRRFARRRGWMERADGSPATWRDEFASLARGTAGRNLFNLGSVFGGLLLALILLGIVAPTGWCGGQPVAPFAAAFIGLILANAGASDSVTLRRVATMGLAGFGGGLAAILTAQAVAGCTSAVEWLGWSREIVEFAAGAAVAFLVHLSHDYLTGDRDDFTGGDEGEEGGA